MHWEHDEIGLVPRKMLVAVAEQVNLVNPLGEWLLARACRDAMEWPGGISVSVNVPEKFFFAGLLVPTVEEVLSKTGLNPGRLELEISEGVLMGDSDAVDKTFTRLKKLGVRLSLDGFGTGFSSLGNLRRAPFERIRIASSFVRGCSDKDSPNAAIVTALVSLASALKMDATAEGVESLDELKLLVDRGARHIQGTIFSPPVTQKMVLKKLETRDFSYAPLGPQKHRAPRKKLLRRIGVVHNDHRYDAMLRNLSSTGALIEGLLGVPVGTQLLLDLGGGQLVVATVRRSRDAMQGVEFETPLVDDGAGGLCTRHRASPRQLEAVYAEADRDDGSKPARSFMQVDVRSATGTGPGSSPGS